MGAGASTLGVTADVGKLRLSPQQQQQLDVVSNLFQLLLENNNIMNLSELVSMSQGQEMCNDLIITLSAQLDKDFQRIQLTAPRGEVTEVGFLSKKGYEAIQKSDVRVDMCRKIARFLVQFVILVAALTASVSIMDGLPDIQPVEQLYVPDNLTEAERLVRLEELNPRLLADLVTEKRLLKEQSAPGFPTQEVYDLFGYLIHYKGFLYKQGSDRLFQFNIDYVRSTTCSGTDQGLPSAPGTPTSRGYGSFMTPDEQREEEIRRVERKARAEASEKAEEQRFAAQRATKEKMEAEEIAEIERMKLEGYRLIAGFESEYATMKSIYMDINAILNSNPINTIYAKVDRATVQPVTENEATLFGILQKYNSVKTLFETLERNYIGLKEDIEKTYGVKKDVISAKLSAFKNSMNNDRARISQYFPTVKADLDQLKNKMTAQAGGANEYYVITITPIEERSASPVLSSNNNASRGFQTLRNTGMRSPLNMGVPTGASNSAFPSSYGTRTQQGGAVPIQFVMDYAGNTYDLDYYCRMGGRVSKDQRSILIGRRLEEIFRTVPTLMTTVINKAMNGTATSALSAFAGFKLDENSIKSLKQFGQMFNKMRAKEIQSPAAHRAYMLASKVENNRLYMKACNDPWGSKSFREIPAYALLGALYTNVLEQPDNGPTKDAGSLLKSAYLSSNESMDDPLWSKKTFDYATQLYSQDALKPLCDTNGFPISNSGAVNIIKRAYGELKGLYSQQLEKVLEYMKRIFVVDRPFITALSAASGFQTTESILRLNPTFLQNSAEVQLLKFLQEARKDLDAHYAKVEQVYVKALTDLQNIPKPAGGARTRKARRKRYNSLRKKRVTRR